MIIISLYTNLKRVAQVNQDELEMWFIDRAAEGFDLRDLYYHSGASHLASYPLATQLTPNCIYRYKSIDALEVVEEVWVQALEFLWTYSSKYRQLLADFYYIVKDVFETPVVVDTHAAYKLCDGVEALNVPGRVLPTENIGRLIDAVTKLLDQASSENGIVVISRSFDGS